MLTTIVLIWMAIQMQAPAWVCVTLSFVLVCQVLDAVLDILLKLSERSKKKAEKVARLSDEQYGDIADKYMEQFEERCKENDE